jgi:hypothetical protein
MSNIMKRPFCEFVRILQSKYMHSDIAVTEQYCTTPNKQQLSL